MWFRGRKDSDFQAEIESHIRLEADRLIAEGMPAAEAQFAARRAFGNVSMSQERFSESQRWQWLVRLGRDLRYGSRLLRKSPAFTAAAALTIALGVGANTAVFSLLDAVLLQLLPVKAPKELVFIDAAGSPPPVKATPYPCLARLPSTTKSFAGLAVFATDESRVEIDGKPEQVFGQVASGNYFELLGVLPAAGRLITAKDESLDPPIAVISDRYWDRRFDRDPAVMGKTIAVLDRTYTIVGVTPPEFLGLQPGRPVDITVPIDTARSLQTYSGPWWFDAIARLRPGVTRGRAQSAANVVFATCMSGSRPSGLRGSRPAQLDLQPAAHGIDTLRSRFSKPLFALMGIAGFVLLLATANIANLLLARGISRMREFAIRLATGASRAHLARQLLSETLLLFALGSVPGIILARWGVTAVESLFAQGRRPITLEANLNWRIMAFSIAVTLVAGLLSGLLPVWRAFRADPEKAIKEGEARITESRGSSSLMGVLVGCQVALSLVLLVGAITFVRTLTNLNHVDPGFQNEHVLTMSIELPERFTPYDKSVGVWNSVLRAVRELPGVRAGGFCVFTPLSGRDVGAPVRVRGFQPATEEDTTIRVNHVSDGYFETLGIKLLHGRLLTGADTENTPKVALINETAARAYFRGFDPIGQSLEFPRKGAPDDMYRIVGVVRDTKHKNLREPSPRLAYLPIQQPRDAYRRLTLTVTSGATTSQLELVEPLRGKLSDLYPGLLISEVITMRQQIDNTLLSERLLSGLSSIFGVLALILAGIGLYGVLSYRIGQQRQAIGIRMALGASPFTVVSDVLRQSGRVIAVGLLCGLPIAFVAARTAESMLWGLKATDPTSYLLGVAVLCLVGGASAWTPARRASRIAPAEALRHG